MTREEKIIATAFTGKMFIDGSEMGSLYEYMEKKVGHGVIDLMLASKEFWEELHKACEQDFIDMVSKEQPSLPSDLDGAAEEYARSWYSRKYGTMPDRCRGCYAHIKAAVEFGAKWMAEQGVGITDFLGVEVTVEGTITDEIANNGLSVMLDNESVFKPGDKVIVKIRKK